jgi:hypothetical protein
MSEWPVERNGVVETVVTTLGPNDRWNVAALGVEGIDDDGPARARTWGRTRTWRNFSERDGGYVQFTRDPVDFVEAALSVREEDDPILDSTDAWVNVEATAQETGEEGGTEWTDWHLRPVDSAVERRVVPVTSRGHAAVVEATVAASRLDVDAYDSDDLRERLDYFEAVVERCGGDREREAFERARSLVAEW